MRVCPNCGSRKFTQVCSVECVLLTEECCDEEGFSVVDTNIEFNPEGEIRCKSCESVFEDGINGLIDEQVNCCVEYVCD